MDSGQESLLTELLKKLVSQSQDTRDTVEKLDKKVDLHIQSTAYEFDKIRTLDDTQNRILEEHIAGVDTLKKMYTLLKSEHEARLEKIEAPRKWLNMSKDLLLWIAAVGGAIITIYHFIKG